jgi:5-methylcytosine-specific restriction endonuclease McrA
MSKQSEAVKRWRERIKLKIIQAMGGQCCICSYKKCFTALELHHIDPAKKEIALGRIISNPKAWDRIVKEVRKCVLLCANCHREVHRGVTVVPVGHPVFDENYAKFSYNTGDVIADLMNDCPICGHKKPVSFKTCSRKCRTILASKVNWGEIDLVALKKQGIKNQTIGNMVGATAGAVRTRINKLIDQGYVFPMLKITRVAEGEYIRKCANCGGVVSNSSESGLCASCFAFQRRKVTRPSKIQLENDLATMPVVAIGKKYGVSDNGVRKWAKSYGISLQERRRVCAAPLKLL